MIYRIVRDLLVRGLMVVVLFVSRHGAAVAVEKNLLLSSCPPIWKDGNRSLVLFDTVFWFNEQVPFGPDDVDVPAKYQRSVLLQCRYKNTDHAIAELTVKVPGVVSKCGATSKLGQAGCMTSVTSGSTSSPEIYAAEPIDMNTTLLGLRLSLGVDEAIAIATRGGFSCVRVTASATCVRERQMLSVNGAAGTIDALTWTLHDGKAGLMQERNRIIRRFGLSRTYAGTKAQTVVWADPGSSVSVEMTIGADALTVTLRHSRPAAKNHIVTK